MNEQQQRQQGYDFYFTNQTLTVEQLKQQSTFFRLGYRAAQADVAKKSNTAFPTTLYDVPQRSARFDATWNDILAATRKPRMRKLHAEHMTPVLYTLIKHVELQKDEIYRYADVVRLVEEGFDKILQIGVDEGILTEHDCKQYNYVPK